MHLELDIVDDIYESDYDVLCDVAHAVTRFTSRTGALLPHEADAAQLPTKLRPMEHCRRINVGCDTGLQAGKGRCSVASRPHSRAP